MYGYHYLPPRFQQGKLFRIPQEQALRSVDAPKMHFHNSGEVTVKKISGVTEPRKCKLNRLSKFRGEQCFSITVDRPDLLPVTTIKKNELTCYEESSISTALAIGVFLIPTDRALKQGISIEPQNSNVGLLADQDGEYGVVNLAEKGLDLLVAFKFQPFISPITPDVPTATIRVTALDGRNFKFRRRKTISMWSTNHLNPVHLIASKRNSPFYRTFDPKIQKRDVKQFIRKPGSPPQEVAP